MATPTQSDTIGLLERKLEKLRREHILVVGNDAGREFQLEEQIAQHERLLDELRREQADRYQLEMHTSQTALKEFLESLDYGDPDLGLLSRVNCDRREHLSEFWQAYERLIDLQRYQVYLLTACDTQMPQLLAERLLYELMHEELDDDQAAVFYRSDDEGRLLIDDLPLKRNLRKSQQAFESYIARQFDLKGSRDLVSFLAGEVINYEYNYIVLAFSDRGSQWKSCDFIPDYYRWIIQQFQQIARGGPQFLLLFSHFAREIHLPGGLGSQNQRLVSDFDQLEQEEAIARHINRLPPVPADDLFDWLRSVGIARNTDMQTVIDLLVRGLSPEERKRYDHTKVLDMDEIDPLQDIVYRYLNR